MATPRDVEIIGGGHNALVAAFYLARSGFHPLILERRSIIGGCAVTEELASGFKSSTLAHCAGPLLPKIAEDMQLARHGLQFVTADPAVTALHPEGRALSFYSDTEKTAKQISQFSKRDAERYPEFQNTLLRLSCVMRDVLQLTPPELDGRPPL